MRNLILLSLCLLSASTLAWESSSFDEAKKSEAKKKLTSEQRHVTQEAGTERAFTGAFWNLHDEGIYVDIVSGEPLFSSQDKYDSHTGWPSFTKPLVRENVIETPDPDGMRTEVKSKYAQSHLGHVFNDGPPPTNKRYCMNSASLRFIPKEKLKDGYAEFEKLFAKKK